MAKFYIDLYLDGYESEEEMADACAEFIYEQLNFSASGVTFLDDPEKRMNELEDALKQIGSLTARGCYHCDEVNAVVDNTLFGEPK